MSPEDDATSLQTISSFVAVRKLFLEVEALERDSKPKGLTERLVQLLPIITTLLAVAVFAGGVLQFRATKEMEFKKILWEKQVESYTELTRAASKLATAPTPNDSLYRAFNEIVNGDFVVVADYEVMSAVVAFVQMYESYRDDPGLHEQVGASARALGRACRSSLIKKWEVNLGDWGDYKMPEQGEHR